MGHLLNFTPNFYSPQKTANSAGTPLLIDLAKFLLWDFLLSLEFSTTSNTHTARENFHAWLPSVIYSLLFTPFLQHYHISERFQRATRNGKFSPAAIADEQLPIKRHTGLFFWFHLHTHTVGELFCGFQPTATTSLRWSWRVNQSSFCTLLGSNPAGWMVARETSCLEVSRPLAMLMSPN